MQGWRSDLHSPPNHQPIFQLMDTIPLRGTDAALMTNVKCEEGGGVEYHIQHHHGLDVVDHYDNPQSELLNRFKGITTTITLQTYCTGERTLFIIYPLSPRFFSSTGIGSRVYMDVYSTFTLISCTYLSNMKNGCNGHYVMIQFKEEDDDNWHFAVVGSLRYLHYRDGNHLFSITTKYW